MLKSISELSPLHIRLSQYCIRQGMGRLDEGFLCYMYSCLLQHFLTCFDKIFPVSRHGLHTIFVFASSHEFSLSGIYNLVILSRMLILDEKHN